MELRNESKNVFTDISSEALRTYTFPRSEVVTIENPLYLSVSKSGGHRILSADGYSHYISPGWLRLQWVAKEGQPHFVK